jgi:hypothetical protein
MACTGINQGPDVHEGSFQASHTPRHERQQEKLTRSIMQRMCTLTSTKRGRCCPDETQLATPPPHHSRCGGAAGQQILPPALAKRAPHQPPTASPAAEQQRNIGCMQSGLCSPHHQSMPPTLSSYHHTCVCPRGIPTARTLRPPAHLFVPIAPLQGMCEVGAEVGRWWCHASSSRSGKAQVCSWAAFLETPPPDNIQYQINAGRGCKLSMSRMKVQGEMISLPQPDGS